MRPYREPWFWLGGLFLVLFAFLTAIAIAYFAKEMHYSLFLNWWMLGACLSFLAAFTCFFGAIHIPEYYLDKVTEPMNARLELWDHLTGKRMGIRAEIGNHDKSELVPSSGSAEILGPEYENQIDQRGDAGQPPPG